MHVGRGHKPTQEFAWLPRNLAVIVFATLRVGLSNIVEKHNMTPKAHQVICSLPSNSSRAISLAKPIVRAVRSVALIAIIIPGTHSQEALVRLRSKKAQLARIQSHSKHTPKFHKELRCLLARFGTWYLQARLPACT